MIRRLALAATCLALAAVLAPSAGASPVATDDGQYQGLGRVFPDPMAGCQRAGRSPCSPNAQGNVPADQFIQYDEFLKALEYMNQRRDWKRYMEVWPLDGKLGDGSGNGADPDVKGNDLGRLEFSPSEAYQSAGLPTTDTSRKKHDLIVVRVTDESVPDAGKKRYALSLSIHGIERAGVEGGTRAMEDMVTAATTQTAANHMRSQDPVVPKAVDPNAPTFDEVLKTTIIYFTYPNPDGWKRGSVSSGGVFFQRYNGNGVDPNRDWPDIGFSFRPYSGLSEPESRSFAAFYDQVGARGGQFSAGDDLHGQNEADALSFTLLPHGRHRFDKDIRIRETAKTIHKNSEQALSWSPIIQPNDAPQGGGVPCAPGLGDTCAKIYGQTWGSVYDTINYTTTGALGDYFDSSIGLGADGIDNEMSFSHVDRNIAFDPHGEQLHVDGNKALIYAHLAELAAPASGQFDPPGRKGYVPTKRVQGGGETRQPTAPEGSQPHAPIDLGPDVGAQNPDPDGVAYPFTINGENVFNGGMRVDVTATNLQGISTGVADLKVQCKGCDVHRSQEPPGGEWITVAEDFNQAELPPLYAQAGLTVAINYPQAVGPDGKPVQWRALVSRESGAPRVHVEFTSGPATTDGATGGDFAPVNRRYDVANTDFFRDLDRFVVKRSEDFDALDPKAVLEGRQSLDSFDSIALADDPLPGYTGEYGGKTRPTGPPTPDKTYEGRAATPSADAGPSVPGSAHRYEFEVGANDANESFTAHIEWPSKEDDFDMRIYRLDGDDRVKVGESVSVGGTGNSETATVPSPAPGKYEVETHNYLARDPNFKGSVTFKKLEFAESQFTAREKDEWAKKLRDWVDDGGNLVLTDGALRLLPELAGIPEKAVNRQTVYAGQTTFATGSGDDKSTVNDRLARNVDQDGARFNTGKRRQMYEPTPLGFAIQDPGGGDQSNAVQWDVDKAEWEKAGGRTAGTSADAGDRDAAPVYTRVTLGELKRGKGQIRIAGALLPQPTEKFDHPLGLEPYAVTYTGYIVVRNLFDTTAGGLPGLPGSRDSGAAGRNFVISRRAVKLKKRRAGVRVSCRSIKGCRGTLVLKMRQVKRVRGKRKARNVTLGKARFNYPAKRRNAVLRVKLSSKRARAASVRRRVRVTAVASVLFGDGTRGRPSAKFFLYRPSGRR